MLIKGLNQGYDELVVRSNLDGRKVAVFCLENEVMIAVDAINRPPDFLESGKSIISGAKPAPDMLKDTATSMKNTAAAIASWIGD